MDEETNEQLKALHKQIDGHIQKEGVSLMAVPGFIYTIGNAERGLPELLLMGNFDPNITGLALNHLTAKMVEEGESLKTGLVDIDWSHPFKVRRASIRAQKEYTIQANVRVGHELYTVLQVMICDRNGVYPGEPNCHPDFDVELV